MGSKAPRPRCATPILIRSSASCKRTAPCSSECARLTLPGPPVSSRAERRSASGRQLEGWRAYLWAHTFYMKPYQACLRPGAAYSPPSTWWRLARGALAQLEEPLARPSGQTCLAGAPSTARGAVLVSRPEPATASPLRPPYRISSSSSSPPPSSSTQCVPSPRKTPPRFMLPRRRWWRRGGRKKA